MDRTEQLLDLYYFQCLPRVKYLTNQLTAPMQNESDEEFEICKEKWKFVMDTVGDDLQSRLNKWTKIKKVLENRLGNHIVKYEMVTREDKNVL